MIPMRAINGRSVRHIGVFLSSFFSLNWKKNIVSWGGMGTKAISGMMNILNLSTDESFSDITVSQTQLKFKLFSYNDSYAVPVLICIEFTHHNKSDCTKFMTNIHFNNIFCLLAERCLTLKFAAPFTRVQVYFLFEICSFGFYII